MINWEDPRKPTMERGEEWMREEDFTSPKPIHIRPPRTWHYYLAWFLMITILISFLTGAGFVILRKGQNIVQHYVERMYGLDK